ncbi:MAG: autotransporter outer membrane beta-barrel domain-containing protein, partial [Roseateles sp.]
LTGSSSTLRTLTGSGQVLLGGRSLLLSQASGEFAGSLSGSGGLQLQAGSWTLSGEARHSGPSEIAGGATLRLDGSLASALHVNSGGSLTGRGLLQGPVSLSPGARLAPGNSPGVLRATQAISLSPGARLEMDLNGPTPGDGAGFHDQLRLSGAAGRFAPRGATLSLRLSDIDGLPANTALYQPRPGERLRLVSAEGGLDGSRFARLERPAGLAPGSRLRLRYDDVAGWIDLQVLHSSFLPLADKLNARASAQALEQLLGLESAGQPLTAPATQLLDAVQALPAASMPARLLALSGELQAALAAAQGLQAEDAVRTLSRRLSPGPWSAPRQEPWVELQAAETRWREDAVASGIVGSRQQLTLGMDLLQAPSWRLGLAGSYASTQLSVQAPAGGRARLQQGLGLVYGAWTSGPWQLDLMGGLGRGQQRSERAEPLGEVSVQGLRSELSTRNRLLAAGLSHHLGEQALGRISPFLRLSWQQGRRAAGAEAPGAQAAAQRLQALAVQGGRAEFGLQLDSADPDPWRSAQTYQARLGLGRDFGALLQPVIQAELAGAALAVRSPQL